MEERSLGAKSVTDQGFVNTENTNNIVKTAVRISVGRKYACMRNRRTRPMTHFSLAISVRKRLHSIRLTSF